MVEINLDVLKEEGVIVKKFKYDDLKEALLAYKALYGELSVAEELACGDNGEGLSFDLHITTEPPYIITTQIDLVV
jgi:hypothetical protein